MTIRFYPRNIGMWRNEFDCWQYSTSGDLKWKEFHNYNEFTEFLKQHQVKSDDLLYPLEFIENTHHIFGDCKSVIQWSLIGWIKEIE